MLDGETLARMAASDGPLVVALSGGGDSLALLHLLAERLGPQRLRVAIVDHALRPGSAQDALEAREFAADAGVAGEILTLAWPEAGPRAQQAARQARYRALCGYARDMGACVVAAGHTRDDQAETVLLRAARGSGWRGLAGMGGLAPLPLWPEGRGLVLARPLLGVRRTALRDALRARAVDWIEDPANANPDYSRVRAREALATWESVGFDPMRLAAIAERLSAHAAALDAEAAALIETAARFEGERVRIARPAWRGPVAVRERALAALAAAAGGHARTPGTQQVSALASQLGQADFKGATLAGAWLRGEAQTIVIQRDRGALVGRADGGSAPAPMPLQAGVEAVWDARVALIASEPGWSVTLEAGVAQLRRAGERAPLSDANARWLIEERVRHILGTAVNAQKP